MAQSRSTKIICLIEWVRTSRLSVKNSFFLITFQMAEGNKQTESRNEAGAIRRSLCFSTARALPTKTKVESGTSQRKSGISIELSNSGLPAGRIERSVQVFPSHSHCSAAGMCPTFRWCRVQGSGLRVQGSGFRVQGSGFRCQGSGFRAQG